MDSISLDLYILYHTLGLEISGFGNHRTGRRGTQVREIQDGDGGGYARRDEPSLRRLRQGRRYRTLQSSPARRRVHLRLPLYPSVPGRERTHGTASRAPPHAPLRVHGREVRQRGQDNRGIAAGLLRRSPCAFAWMARERTRPQAVRFIHPRRRAENPQGVRLAPRRNRQRTREQVRPHPQRHRGRARRDHEASILNYTISSLHFTKHYQIFRKATISANLERSLYQIVMPQ